eukprot:CAMPEP_0177608484 /NCGR_PEP_ID=MMETSP0419_2-20121207/18498_1 /TAXON_ID=582737 /ORGANISM="Tetraselmis sp., Strain GSL018" /LENGTH=443 /DNA_ID=CAMNT_0019103181 /DNA_START=239 /DNA_END=1570 /DNA_ORIENTATION=-
MAASASDILSKDDLIAYIAAGCKPKSEWRIGTEHEKIVFNLADNTRADYSQIKKLLEFMVDRFGWQPMMEGENIIGCKMGGQSVTLEPGGQFELSGAPLDSLHKTCAEVNGHLYQAKAIAEEMGVGFLGTGFDPKWRVEEVPIMPKGRYKLMRDYMPTVGTMGLDMMFRSCTVQVNLDFASEADMVEKFRIGLALQPVATALFANSPFTDGKPNGFKSFRSHVWTDVDNARCGRLPFVFEDGFGFEKYVDYALDVPMYFVYRKDKGYVNALGMSFRDFMEGKLPALPGEYPTLDDWEAHLSTIFPEVRLKKFLEMRGADSGRWKMICALPALWVGLLYDDQAQAAAYDLISDFSQDEHEFLRAQVPVTGLQTPFRGGTVQDLAKEVLELSKGGLSRRGLQEESFIAELVACAETGQVPADTWLQSYNSTWGGSVDPYYVDGAF